MNKIEANKKSCMKPMPSIIVSCRDKNGKDNALVVGYACNCSYTPPMIMVGIVPTRYSYHIIKETGCFVVNIAAEKNKDIYDYLGKVSGRDEDKFGMLNIKTKNGDCVNAPLIIDCPVNIECRVVNSVVTGSHEMFIGVVEKVHADKEYTDANGDIRYDDIKIISKQK